ncbi:uncharacterized protein LOC120602935 isoform X2 [Pteropus medius]|uniref:uncharacterized protein LOC120602935 isoform X2 n=1 Tax=Pteropus vampyrus TaxID=132908 RepID=UPI00196B414B|nr:uncharacterized protein LOC120602935 isoform X2 [Pteropus giganteus]
MVFGLCHQRERLFKSLYVVQIFILAGGLYYYLQRSVEKTAPAHEVAGASLQVGTCDRARRLGLAPGPQMANQRVRVRVRVRLRVRGFWRHFLLPAKSRNPGPTPCGLAIWSPQGPGAVAWINAKEQVALVHVLLQSPVALGVRVCRFHSFQMLPQPSLPLLPLLVLQPVEETLRPVWGPMNKCYPVTAQRRRIKSGKKPAPKAVTPEATGRPSDTAPKEEANSLSQDDGKARSPRLEAASPIRPGEEAAEEAAAEIPGWTGDEKAQKESAVYLGKTANSTLLRTASLPNLGDPVEVTDSRLLSDPPVPGRGDVQAARSPDLLE